MNKLKTKNPSDDVSLADGHGFMVKEQDYQAHIKIAIDHREVRPNLFIGGCITDGDAPRNPHAMSIGHAIMPTPAETRACCILASEPRPVQDMGSSSLTVLSTFRKEKGRSD
jgi:hypothetical protein